MKRLFGIFLLLAVIVSTLNPLQVSADSKLTLRSLQNEYASEKAKYEENQRKLNLTQSEINSKNARIQTLKKEMTTISNEVGKLNDEIDKYKLSIKEKIVSSKTLLEQYQVNETSSLYYDYIFNADSVSDMTYRSAVIKEIVDYNEKMISTLNTMIADNKKREQEIEKRKEEINKLEAELGNQVASLGQEKNQLSVGGLSIASQMSAIQSKINYYKGRGCKLDDVIGVDCDKNSSGPVRRPTQQGYVTQNNHLTNGYFHRGLDIGSSRGSGEKIYPVASGTIMGIEKDTNGALIVRIDHLINGKHYTSLYGHLSKFSPNIWRGKKVTSDEYIGYMGNTGYSKGIHLHIELYNCWLYSDSQCLTWTKYTNFALSQFRAGYNIRKMIPVTNGLYNKWLSR